MVSTLSANVVGLQTDILRFLTLSPIVTDSGHLFSWVNPEHAGYVYPEGMGLYLTLVSQLAAVRDDAQMAACVGKVAIAMQEIATPHGALGLRGHLYPFDTCMGVTGLCAYKRYLGGGIDADLLGRMASFIIDMAGRRLTILNPDGSSPDVAPSWSATFGASMLKEVIALDDLARETGEERYRTLAMEIADEVIDTSYDEGSFHVYPRDKAVYTHPHCYALEGLLHLRSRGYRDTTPLLRAGADKLSEWQDEDGGQWNWNAAWAGVSGRQRLKVGDASAQAVRIWLAVDREGYRLQIERGLAFLASIRSPQGGLYYAAGSRDVNAITSIFAAQAMEWYLREPRPDAIA